MDLHFSTMKIMKGLFCFMLLLIMNLCDASALSLASQNNLKVEKHLSELKKETPLKSFKSKDGDVIDCVHMSHQPALDHPLLKNHEIQMKPSYHPDCLFVGKKLSHFTSKAKEDKEQLWQLNGRCPQGTIPITRTKQEVVFRASSINSFGRKKFKGIINSFGKEKSNSISQNESTGTKIASNNYQEFVVALVKGDKYYGAKATITIWEPKLQRPTEFSSSQLWIFGRLNSDSNINAIQAGWIVDPEIYGDNTTRFYIHWTSDNYQSTGCFDLQCSGFVQINNEIPLGGRLSPLSTIHGIQSVLTILIWKDSKQNAWWLQVGNDTLVGYWPAALFTHLAESASEVEWGGAVSNSQLGGKHTTTQMGSGHFPEDGFRVASSIRNLQVADSSMKFRTPSNIGTLATRPGCYNGSLEKSEEQGYFFLYGGAGRNPNCP